MGKWHFHALLVGMQIAVILLESYLLVPVKLKNVPALSCDNFPSGLHFCAINESISKNKGTHILECKCKDVHRHVSIMHKVLCILHYEL